MKTRWIAAALLAGLAGAMPSAALGQGQGPVTVDRVDLGTHVFGDRLAALVKSQSADEKEKEEAEQIVERLKRYAGVLKARAKRWTEDGRPSEAQELLKTLSEQFKDSDVGKEAADQLAKDKEDEAFKKELEAENLWKGVEPAYYKIVPPKKGDEAEKWKGKNAGVLKPILDKFTALSGKYGETKACQAYKKRAAWMGVK
jgi:hypothetical protein